MSAQLDALRATLLAALQQVDALREIETVARRTPPPPDPDAPCEHPERKRTSLATFGHPHRFQCDVCDLVVDPDAAKEG